MRQKGRRVAGALVLLIGLTVAAAPASAAEPAPAPSPTPTPTLMEAAESAVDSLPAHTLAQATQPAAPPSAETNDRPFIKTPKGILAVSLTVVGLGIMAYSMSDDRVKSPNK
jgi:hypothetical protein